jgi:hypothetical protein
LQVINVYIKISNIATATTSVLATMDSRKLVGECGGGVFTLGRGSGWVERIATIFVGGRIVYFMNFLFAIRN